MTDELKIDVEYIINNALKKLWYAQDIVKYYGEKDRGKALEHLDNAETEICKAKIALGVGHDSE